ncbi:MAG: HK97-gp10 family putative phage morphogenesis protein [Hydrogenophaga sp.]|uniref:HK97-gp10 family putative phage morphogenesis protein n=1 Tax=Hydrogenophaga sp. TaxID=1904254 RepID=UPI004035B01F
MAIETGVSGLAELYKVMQALPAVVEGNVMRGALRAGLRVVQKEAEVLVPEKELDLRKSLRIRLMRRSLKRGWVRMQLVAGGKDAPNAHWAEFGTASYYVGKGRSVRRPYKIQPKKAGALLFGGKVREVVTHPGARPQPYMRPAIDRRQGDALAATVAYLRRRIPIELKKAGK